MTLLESELRPERGALATFDAALARAAELLQAGDREGHRRALAVALEQGTRQLASLEASGSGGPASARAASKRLAARWALQAQLARVQAARAEDALHGAGQLSLSAQRAPTLEACDDGWARVAELVAVSVAAAAAANELARELTRETPASPPARRARTAALRAERAAAAATQILVERNHAYTFHAHRGFSFGEGWYLAAAAVLAGVTIQLEPDQDGTAQAQAFLTAAGLAGQLQPYRSRPRAMKHTTHLVARAFRAEPEAAQRRLRAAFLGERESARAVAAWLDERLRETAPDGPKVLLWVRYGVHHPARNTDYAELVRLAEIAQDAGLVPVLIGDALRGGPLPPGALDLTLFWREPTFCGLDQRRAQLECFELLRERYAVVGQLGVTTAGMDGPALMGMPTLYLTQHTNVRMREWVGAVPGYEEVVREHGYLARTAARLTEWARAHHAHASAR